MFGMTEKLSQFISLVFVFSIGLLCSAQDNSDGDLRKYYGEGGREINDINEIRKEKVLVISQEGYRTFSHIGSVGDLIKNNNGELPALKPLKSDLSSNVSFEFGTMYLKMGPNDHSDLSYARDMDSGRPMKKKYTQTNVDSIVGECSHLGNFLSYNLALAGLVDTSGSFFNDAEKHLKLDVTIEKLNFKTSFNPYITMAEATFTLDIKDVYGTEIFSETLILKTNLYEGSYSVLYLEDFGCDYQLSQYAIRGFLLFDLSQALAFEISHSQSIIKKLKERATALSGAAVEESLVLKKMPNANSSVNQLLEAVVTIETDDGHGSGCLVSEDGYIISNHHVAGVKTKKLKVILNDGSEYSAELVRSDAYSDLALIKISSDRKFRFLNAKAESKVGLGDKVRVIGTPADPKLGQTLTAGIISSLRKNNRLDLIQTDAHISPGNSGGALIDANGELIGIVSSKAMGIITEGIGFAIPVKYVIERLNVNFE
jgi:small nuclear ribonucleoprotein (snRNP)-like protein